MKNKYSDSIKMKILGAIILVISSLTVAFCKSNRTDSTDVYYIDSSVGNDHNPGTPRKPLKTIAELNSRLLKKAASVCFAGGQIYEGTLRLKDIRGTITNPLIITSSGKGRAVINGENREALLVESCENLCIKDLDIRGNGRKNGNASNGLSLTRSHSIRVEKLKAEGFQKSGVDLYDCTGIQVKDVLAIDNGFCGINVMGSDKSKSGKILIKDCKAENNAGDPTNLDNHSGNGILVGVSDSVLIDHCSATNNGWDMPRTGNGPVGIWTWESNRVTIQYCVSYRNKTSENAKDGGGFDLDGGVTNSVIQYCLSYENEGAGYGLFQYSGASDWANNVVRYCVSINDAATTEGAGSFFIWNGSGEEKQLANCQIYNNFVYSDSVPVISFENASAHKNFTFSNNVFIGSGQLISGQNSGSSFKGNIWWGMRKSYQYSDWEFMKLDRFFQALKYI
jgi:hypothetical protein